MCHNAHEDVTLAISHRKCAAAIALLPIVRKFAILCTVARLPAIEAILLGLRLHRLPAISRGMRLTTVGTLRLTSLYLKHVFHF